MRHALIICAAGIPLLASCAANAEPAADMGLSWMTGCWAHEDGATREIWSAPEGGLMFGYSVTLRGGEAVFFEDLRIEMRDGKAVYIASPGGAPPTEFTETERGGISITFENPDNDYPQRIRYDLNRVALIATISLADGSKVRSFPMARCETAEDDATEIGEQP
ncbi:MAG: DUF6265 family protein [Henriciella sp.]|uniref:DUF6265 family protein n=1 Tax=Henriciella sp. TaxID=1968823 RepID=UPI003C746B0B